MDVSLLKDFVIIFGLSILVLLACFRFKIPSIVGFLVTGVVTGPQGLGLIRNVQDVKTLAEFGIIILLFTVGVEFSLKNIWRFKRYFFLGGSLQVLLTILCGAFVAKFLGRPTGESIFLGFLLSLSSTAIVLRILQDRMETRTPHGHLVMGILVFQDIIVLPMMLLTPILAGGNLSLGYDLFWTVGKGALILVGVFLAAEFVVPRLLYYVAKTRSRELFLLTILTLVTGIAVLTASMGLSLALGAFLAGLIISDSEYGNQAIGDMIPLQDIFTSFFFVSIGMLLEVGFFWHNPGAVLWVACGVIGLKSLVAFFVALILKLPAGSALMTSVSLAQVGEFSFVLIMYGKIFGLGTEYLTHLFLAVAIITMGATPFLIAWASKITGAVQHLPFLHRVEETGKKDHVIIAGYGFSGRNLARSCQEAEVPYLVLDLDPDKVRAERKEGKSIVYGDATHEYVLKHANISEAKVLAIVVDDPKTSLAILEHARRLNPTLYIIARVRHIQEMQDLYYKGATAVIPDEFGSTIEIFTRVLEKYSVEEEKLEKFVSELREEGYELLRHRYVDSTIFTNQDHSR